MFIHCVNQQFPSCTLYVDEGRALEAGGEWSHIIPWLPFLGTQTSLCILFILVKQFIWLKRQPFVKVYTTREAPGSRFTSSFITCLNIELVRLISINLAEQSSRAKEALNLYEGGTESICQRCSR